MYVSVLVGGEFSHGCCAVGLEETLSEAMGVASDRIVFKRRCSGILDMHCGQVWHGMYMRKEETN